MEMFAAQSENQQNIDYFPTDFCYLTFTRTSSTKHKNHIPLAMFLWINTSPKRKGPSKIPKMNTLALHVKPWLRLSTTHLNQTATKLQAFGTLLHLCTPFLDPHINIICSTFYQYPYSQKMLESSSSTPWSRSRIQPQPYARPIP